MGINSRRAAVTALLSAVSLVFVGTASAATSFSNNVLTVPFTSTDPTVSATTTGDSEPAVSIGTNGQMVVGGLAWVPAQVNMWLGPAGSVPSYFGALDQSVAIPGKGRSASGDGDESFDIGSTGTIHFADLITIPPSSAHGHLQTGVAETNCPSTATSPSDCNRRVLDTNGADRQWITSAGSNVWLAWHDHGNSSLVHVDYSANDGATWSQAASPIPGQGKATSEATFNNEEGPIVADPTTGDVFDIYAAGIGGLQKAKSATYNNIFVSRSVDQGKHWQAVRVFSAPPGTGLANIFPSLAVDPANGDLYATWTDTHGVAVSQSTNHGVTWSTPVTVSSATTTVMPWVAAYNGKVDVVYYGSSGSSPSDPTAVWNTYDSQYSGGAWSQNLVSSAPVHTGEICLNGQGCANQLVTRTLLDLFQVAENPATGKAAIVYTEDTTDTWTSGGTTFALPQIVLALEN